MIDQIHTLHGNFITIVPAEQKLLIAKKIIVFWSVPSHVLIISFVY